MTRPLRNAHRAIWIVLAVVLPWLLVAAVLARRGATPENPGFMQEQLK